MPGYGAKRHADNTSSAGQCSVWCPYQLILIWPRHPHQSQVILTALHYTLLHVSLFIRAVNKPLSSQRRPLACKDHKQHVVWISKILKVGRRYDLRAMQCEIPRKLVDSSTVYLGQWAGLPCSVIAIDHLHQSRAPQCTMGGMCKLDQCSPTPPNPNNLHWCSV